MNVPNLNQNFLRNLLNSLLFFALLGAITTIPVFASSPQISNQTERAFKVDISGKGQPMILIPGLSSSGAVWDGTTAKYRAGGYECHTLTLAGFAGQPPVKTAAFLERVQNDLISYIREKKLKQPVIVGHSLGGFLALSIASAEPELVGRIVIVDALPFLPAALMPGATVETVKPQAEMMRKMMATPQNPDERRQMQIATLKTMITDPAKIEIATNWAIASDPQTIAQAVYEMFTTDLRSSIATIKSPVLIIAAVGSGAPQTEKIYRQQFAKLTGYQLVVSPTGKHFLMFDDPETMFKAMDGFLMRQNSGKPAKN